LRLIDFKENVTLRWGHFEPHITLILRVALAMAPPTEGDVVTVTSANDGRHKRGSKHYTNEAFDFRVRASDPSLEGNVIATDEGTLEEIGRRWAFTMSRVLGNKYDVLFEKRKVDLVDGLTVTIMWIHAEYDPLEEVIA
jgi:hypothetical protein